MTAQKVLTTGAIELPESIIKNVFRDEDNRAFELEYNLHGHKSESGKMLYSISVKNTSNGVFLDQEETRPVFDCHSKAYEVVNRLAKGTVMPVHLIDIVDDLLEEDAEKNNPQEGQKEMSYMMTGTEVLREVEDLKEFVAKRVFSDEDGNKTVLEYYLHRHESKSGDMLYSISIKETDLNGVVLAENQTPAMFTCGNASYNMAYDFAQGDVFPIHLLDVIEWYEPSGLKREEDAKAPKICGEIELKELIAEKIVQVGDTSFKLEYILNGHTTESDELMHGVSIIKSTPNGMLLEEATTPPVVECYYAACELVDLLVEGIVTPCTLLDVVEDIIKKADELVA